MKAVFVELPPFARHRAEYLDDDAFKALQQTLMANPLAGDVTKDAGGLRKIRFADERRGKGKRSGLRIIYFWWAAKAQCRLFTLYDKDQADDLTSRQRNQLAQLLERQLNSRSAL